MNINSANTQNINQIQNLDTVATGNDANDANKVGVLEKGINTNEHEVSISKTGQIGSYIANLPEEQQQEIKGYLQSIREAQSNGSFDLQTSIDNAPEAFNNLLSQLNISGEEVLGNTPDMQPKNLSKLSSEHGQAAGISVYADVAAQSKINS
ncbi:hypothetical protein [Colwellia sp. E150_009]